MDMDRVAAVFRAMDESYTTDADDVAVIYLRLLFTERGSRQDALRLNREACATLVRPLDESWTTTEEARLIQRLRALRALPNPNSSSQILLTIERWQTWALNHAKIESTVRYFGVDVEDVLNILKRKKV